MFDYMTDFYNSAFTYRHNWSESDILENNIGEESRAMVYLKGRLADGKKLIELIQTAPVVTPSLPQYKELKKFVRLNRYQVDELLDVSFQTLRILADSDSPQKPKNQELIKEVVDKADLLQKMLERSKSVITAVQGKVAREWKQFLAFYAGTGALAGGAAYTVYTYLPEMSRGTWIQITSMALAALTGGYWGYLKATSSKDIEKLNNQFKEAVDKLPQLTKRVEKSNEKSSAKV
jgi:hypothetical protein